MAAPQKAWRGGYWTQVSALLLINFSQGLMLTAPFTLAVYMVRHFLEEEQQRQQLAAGEVQDASSSVGDVSEQKVGQLTGLLAASFSIACFFVALFWGVLSNVIGRKMVIVIGCATSAVSMCWFGVAASFSSAFASRFFGGLFNGVLGAWKTMVGEMYDGDALIQGKTFSYMSIAWGVGTTVGPLLGGALADPCKHHPDLKGCGRGGLLRHRPFMLPCLVCSVLMAAATVACAVLLLDTLPEGQRQEQLRKLRGRWRRVKGWWRGLRGRCGGQVGSRGSGLQAMEEEEEREKEEGVHQSDDQCALLSSKHDHPRSDHDDHSLIAVGTGAGTGSRTQVSNGSTAGDRAVGNAVVVNVAEKAGAPLLLRLQQGHREGQKAELMGRVGRECELVGHDVSTISTAASEPGPDRHASGDGVRVDRSHGDSATVTHGAGGAGRGAGGLAHGAAGEGVVKGAQLRSSISVTEHHTSSTNPLPGPLAAAAPSPVAAAGQRAGAGVAAGAQPQQEQQEGDQSALKAAVTDNTRPSHWMLLSHSNASTPLSSPHAGSLSSPRGPHHEDYSPWRYSGSGAAAPLEQQRTSNTGAASNNNVNTDHAAGSDPVTSYPSSPAHAATGRGAPGLPRPAALQLEHSDSLASYSPGPLSSTRRALVRSDSSAVLPAFHRNSIAYGSTLSRSNSVQARMAAFMRMGSRVFFLHQAPAPFAARGNAPLSQQQPGQQLHPNDHRNSNSSDSVALIHGKDVSDIAHVGTTGAISSPQGQRGGSEEEGEGEEVSLLQAAAPRRDGQPSSLGVEASQERAATHHGTCCDGPASEAIHSGKGPELHTSTTVVPSHGLSNAYSNSSGRGVEPPVMWHKDVNVRLSLAYYGLVCMLFAGVDELLPIFASAPVASGGLGLEPSQLALPLAVFGIALILYSAVGYPYLQRVMGTMRLALWGLVASVLTCIMMPLSQTALQASGKALALTMLYATMIVKCFSACSAFTGALIMVNAAPPRAALGEVNGVGQTIAALVRGAGPALAGVMWSMAVAIGKPGQQFIPFAVIALLSIASGCVCRAVRLPNLK